MKPIIKDNNGKIRICLKIKTKIVSEYFHSKFKRPTINNTLPLPTNNNQTNFTEDEVKTAISCLKNGKACGLNNIKAEQMKSATAIYISASTELLNEIVNEQKPTENITDGNLILLQNLINQKEISKISDHNTFVHDRKTLSTIVLRKIRNVIDAHLLASTAHRRGRSTNG